LAPTRRRFSTTSRHHPLASTRCIDLAAIDGAFSASGGCCRSFWPPRSASPVAVFEAGDITVSFEVLSYAGTPV